MKGSELKRIRDLLDVGSVEFIENYLGAKYHSGKKWISDEIDVPGPVEKCAKLWQFIAKKKQISHAKKFIEAKKTKGKNVEHDIDISIEADALRMRWLLDGNGYFMEHESLCALKPSSDAEKMNARKLIDQAMNEGENQ
tara:strand:+ start:980 stop:1396 length:417 start_codon:yes stop_codon:yes gene_type:complete